MQLTIEFTGIARMLAGKGSEVMTLPNAATYRDVIRRLANLYPEMIGILITPEGDDFLSSNLFIINGEMGNPAMILDGSPRDKDWLVLVSVITGG